MMGELGMRERSTNINEALKKRDRERDKEE